MATPQFLMACNLFNAMARIKANKQQIPVGYQTLPQMTPPTSSATVVVTQQPKLSSRQYEGELNANALVFSGRDYLFYLNFTNIVKRYNLYDSNLWTELFRRNMTSFWKDSGSGFASLQLKQLKDQDFDPSTTPRELYKFFGVLQESQMFVTLNGILNLALFKSFKGPRGNHNFVQNTQYSLEVQ